MFFPCVVLCSRLSDIKFALNAFETSRTQLAELRYNSRASEALTCAIPAHQLKRDVSSYPCFQILLSRPIPRVDRLSETSISYSRSRAGDALGMRLVLHACYIWTSNALKWSRVAQPTATCVYPSMYMHARPHACTCDVHCTILLGLFGFAFGT